MNRFASSFLFVLLVCFVSSLRGQFETNICNYRCVGEDVYNVYCGGATCVSGTINAAQEAALCSEPCLDAIAGEPLLLCLRSADPERPDLVELQLQLVDDVDAFCVGLGPGAAPEPEAAPTPEATTPEAATPEATTPEAVTPEEPQVPEEAPAPVTEEEEDGPAEGPETVQGPEAIEPEVVEPPAEVPEPSIVEAPSPAPEADEAHGLEPIEAEAPEPEEEYDMDDMESLLSLGDI